MPDQSEIGTSLCPIGSRAQCVGGAELCASQYRSRPPYPQRGVNSKQVFETKRALSPVIWLAASPEGRTQFLGEIGLPAVLAAMPASWSKIIEARVLGLRSKASSGDPDLRLSKIMRTALSHIAIADSPETGKPAAQGQESRRFRPCVP